MKAIDIPTWKETAERKAQLELSDRTIAQCVILGDKLNPLEQFIYDHEPSDETGGKKWRSDLKDAIEFFMPHRCAEEVKA